jgi:hypothetical protein
MAFRYLRDLHGFDREVWAGRALTSWRAVPYGYPPQ